MKRKIAMKDNKEGGDHDVRDDWASFSLSVIDHVNMGNGIRAAWNTFTSCMKDHGFASMRRYVRKSSSMTLNEALCGRQPDHLFYFIYINMTVYIALFNQNIK